MKPPHERLRHNLVLAKLTAQMTPTQKQRTVDVLKECDIARLLKQTSIRRELVAIRKQYGGLIGTFLKHLSNCTEDDAMAGINYLANKHLNEVSNL